MAEFYEDEDGTALTALERRILKGCPTFPHVNTLLKRLKAETLTDPASYAVARAIVVMGTSAEPGAPFFTLFDPRDLRVRFRSKRNQLELDEALSPYYGNVLPGLREMQGTAIDVSLSDYWLRWFRSDSGVYRPWVVAAMSLAGCVEELRREA